MTLQTFPVFYKKTTNLLCFFGWFICLSLISVANRHKCLLHFGKKGWRLFCIICTYDDLQRVTWLINRLYTRSPETTSDNSLKEEKRVWRIKSDVLEKSYTMCFQFWWDFFFLLKLHAVLRLCCRLSFFRKWFTETHKKSGPTVPKDEGKRKTTTAKWSKESTDRPFKTY